MIPLEYSDSVTKPYLFNWVDASSLLRRKILVENNAQGAIIFERDACDNECAARSAIPPGPRELLIYGIAYLFYHLTLSRQYSNRP